MGKSCRQRRRQRQRIPDVYDQDGKVQNVYQVGYGNVATYTYGGSSTPISNGLPISVTDNIGSVQQQIDYVSSGSGVGQAYHVYEYRNSSTTADNVCSYAYGATGDRSEATYSTGAGATLAQWGYFDYIPVGDPSKNTRAFQTLCKLDGNNNRTPEEFHYAYDSQGRILDCAFAQTPSNNTPDSNGYYDKALAATRCRAHYEYDAGGRLYWIAHYWDTLSGGSYSSQTILGQYFDYEVNTGLNRGLKLDAKYETPSSPGSSTFQISQTDTYGSNGYDSQLDYLIAANYGDNQPNPSQSWTYDAAGNRNDTVADTLNRPVTIGGVACQSDMNGNRTQFGSIRYSWDQLNRLHQYNNSTTYTYRAGGMRVYKTNSSGSTSYRYDGQVGSEDIDYASNGTVSKVTDYGIGARSIDAMFITQGGITSAVYPLNDAHGNMIETISRSGTSGFTPANYRTFDAWGNIRVGNQIGDPKGRYCANLGHKQDDESGLVYMRARYCEPGSGRFLSQDDSRAGRNWFTYANNDPINYGDRTGHDVAGILELWFGTLLAGVAGKVLEALVKKIWKVSLQKIISNTIFDAGTWLMKIAQGLISGGQAEMQAGAEILEAGGDSLTQASQQAGISMCLGGAAEEALGLSLYYVAIGIQWLGLLSGAGGG